jgi:hypothetical protein
VVIRLAIYPPDIIHLLVAIGSILMALPLGIQVLAHGRMVITKMLRDNRVYLTANFSIRPVCSWSKTFAVRNIVFRSHPKNPKTVANAIG